MQHLSPRRQRAIERAIDIRAVRDLRSWLVFPLLFLFTVVLGLRVLVLMKRHYGEPLALLVFVLWAIIGWWIAIRLWLRIYRSHAAAVLARHHLCPTCGYDLRATPNHCPECGTTHGADCAHNPK